jgi:hypothetical protein
MNLTQKEFLRGMLLGILLFGMLLAILLLAGDLSASKFIYVDF